MPRNTTKFVRLADHAQFGCQVDLETGWGISGRDVRRVPDDPRVQEFVKSGINRGVFEEAGQAEWDEVHEADVEEDDIPAVRMVTSADRVLPENKLRLQVEQKRAAIEARQAERDAAYELGEDEDAADDGDIRTWSDEDLKAELSRRGQATTGVRKTLLSRLSKAIEAEESADEEDDEESES